MKLIDVQEQKQWEAFVATQPYAQIFQSWAWGELRMAQGSQVKRIALVDDAGEWQSAVQLEFRRRRFGLGYWFAQRGPVFAESLSEKQRSACMAELIALLKERPEMQKSALFWRMEPVGNQKIESPPLVEGEAGGDMCRVEALDPSSTILLDLIPESDTLLSAMHEKTRYNIRLAERKGVTTRIATTAKDVEAFLDLMDETASRDKFVQHSRKYLTSMHAFLQEHSMGQIRVAEWEGRIICANLELAYGDTVTYLYGASSSKDRNVMAPFALQWAAIQDAKQKGFREYDFWGCNPASKEMPDYKTSWEGITRFKLGWGGRLVTLVGTWDFPLNATLYRFVGLQRFFRR